jgi:hypothetical protein
MQCVRKSSGFFTGVLRGAALAVVVTLILMGCNNPVSDDNNGENGNSNSNDISYTAVQTGGTSGTADSTGIVLTFSESVTGLTADQITVTNGTGAVTKGALSGSGTNWSLAITVTTQGNVSVSIGKDGISAEVKTVAVYKGPSLGGGDLFEGVWYTENIGGSGGEARIMVTSGNWALSSTSGVWAIWGTYAEPTGLTKTLVKTGLYGGASWQEGGAVFSISSDGQSVTTEFNGGASFERESDERALQIQITNLPFGGSIAVNLVDIPGEGNPTIATGIGGTIASNNATIPLLAVTDSIPVGNWTAGGEKYVYLWTAAVPSGAPDYVYFGGAEKANFSGLLTTLDFNDFEPLGIQVFLQGNGQYNGNGRLVLDSDDPISVGIITNGILALDFTAEVTDLDDIGSYDDGMTTTTGGVKIYYDDGFVFVQKLPEAPDVPASYVYKGGIYQQKVEGTTTYGKFYLYSNKDCIITGTGNGGLVYESLDIHAGWNAMYWVQDSSLGTNKCTTDPAGIPSDIPWLLHLID